MWIFKVNNKNNIIIISIIIIIIIITIIIIIIINIIIVIIISTIIIISIIIIIIIIGQTNRIYGYQLLLLQLDVGEKKSEVTSFKCDANVCRMAFQSVYSVDVRGVAASHKMYYIFNTDHRLW